MTKLQLLSGTVSHVNYFAKTTSSLDRSSGRMRFRHKVSFRIGDRLAFFQGTPNLGAGDVVTAVGTEQDGELAISVFVNESTGIKYSDHRAILIRYLLGGAALLLAILLISRIPVLSVLLAAVGLWSIWLARKKKQQLDTIIFRRNLENQIQLDER
jgi:hypothetical protein